jgi:hypothetical protein
VIGEIVMGCGIVITATASINPGIRAKELIEKFAGEYLDKMASDKNADKAKVKRACSYLKSTLQKDIELASGIESVKVTIRL